MPRAARPTWSALKRALSKCGEPELLALVKELFELSADNRAFLAARFLARAAHTDAAEGFVAAPYRQRIHDAFYDKGGWPRSKPRLADARKGIRDYRKATADMAGTLELMLTFVETGTEFSLDFGAEDASLFNSLSSVLGEIEAACGGKHGLALYDEFRERLLDLADRAGGIGWGYGDHVQAVIQGLEERWTDAGAPPRADS